MLTKDRRMQVVHVRTPPALAVALRRIARLLVEIISHDCRVEPPPQPRLVACLTLAARLELLLRVPGARLGVLGLLLPEGERF